MDTEQKPVEVVAPEAPTENTVGQHTYFMSKSAELEKALAEASERNLKVLGFERTRPNPVSKDRKPFRYSVANDAWVMKCMTKKE